MACYSPLKGYKDPDSGGLVFKKTSVQMDVACGQCLGCRLDRTLMWAMRIVHESSLYEDLHGNSFVTFTYRGKSECTLEELAKGHYVPDDYSLNKKHFQKFIKRLRKHFPQQIRYFHCGEYGEENLRPHYHACLFNCSFDDMVVEQSEQGITTYSSPTLQKLWPFGFCTIGELNYDTAAYTAGYILKKINGQQAMEEYLRSDEYGVAYWVVAPYVTMSLKPGIGAKFYEEFKNDFFPSDESPVPGKGIINKVPRYYETILEAENPKLHEVVKALRQEFIRAHGADFTPERLRAKYECQKARQLKKKRTL